VKSLELKVESEERSYTFHFRLSTINLLVFSVQTVTAAATTELVHLKPVRRVLFVLGRHVIALFALGALQNNVISRHTSS
jgi:hypothetical protein